MWWELNEEEGVAAGDVRSTKLLTWLATKVEVAVKFQHVSMVWSELGCSGHLYQMKLAMDSMK